MIITSEMMVFRLELGVYYRVVIVYFGLKRGSEPPPRVKAVIRSQHVGVRFAFGAEVTLHLPPTSPSCAPVPQTLTQN